MYKRVHPPDTLPMNRISLYTTVYRRFCCRPFRRMYTFVHGILYIHYRCRLHHPTFLPFEGRWIAASAARRRGPAKNCTCGVRRVLSLGMTPQSRPAAVPAPLKGEPGWRMPPTCPCSMEGRRCLPPQGVRAIRYGERASARFFAPLRFAQNDK